MKTCMLITITALLISAGGCGFEKRDPANVQYFLLNVQRTSSAVPVESHTCLRVHPCRLAASFDSRSLIYRTSPVHYETDYYNLFLTNPKNQITDALRGWFRNAGISDCGLTDEPGLDKFTLEPSIEILCADFSSPGKPVAVVQMHVLLTRYDSDCSCVKIILDKTFTVQTPLTERPMAAEIVEGMSQSLVQIFEDLEKFFMESL